MVHVLLIVAMVRGPLLVAMGRVIGAVDIQQDAHGWAVLLPLLQIHPQQRMRQASARLPVHGVLQPGEGRLAGQVWATLGQLATDQLEQRVAPQGVRIVLVFVATGDLEDPLPDQRRQGVPYPTVAPFGHARGQCRTDAGCLLGLQQPGQAAITGQASRHRRRLPAPGRSQ